MIDGETKKVDEWREEVRMHSKLAISLRFAELCRWTGKKRKRSYQRVRRTHFWRKVHKSDLLNIPIINSAAA